MSSFLPRFVLVAAGLGLSVAVTPVLADAPPAARSHASVTMPGSGVAPMTKPSHRVFAKRAAARRVIRPAPVAFAPRPLPVPAEALVFPRRQYAFLFLGVGY